MIRRGPVFAGIAMGVVAVLAIVLLVLPKMGEVSETEQQLTEAQDTESSLLVQLGALQDAQAGAPETEAKIAKIEEQVPPTADLPELFRLLQTAADGAAVDFFAFTPGTPLADPTGGFSVIPAQITVTGGYFSLDEMLFAIEALPRAAKVTTIAITPNAPTTDASGTTTSTSTGSLQLQLSAEFYTTDVSAGPGSIPGPTETVPAPGV